MNKMTTEELIIRLNIVHNNKYDYSGTEFINWKSRIKVICYKHGEFTPFIHNHLKGSGCQKCQREIPPVKSKEQSAFIEEAIAKHGKKYDYSKTKYVNKRTKLIIICKEHGEFLQFPGNHLNGAGCNKCKGKLISKAKSMGCEEFISKSKIVHVNIYDYSKIKYIDYTTIVEIICPYHGSYFQKPIHHLRGCGCPVCNFSKGELKIKSWLEENGVEYEKEKTFKDLYHMNIKNKLRFDFYIKNKNLCIEFDGEQHFRPNRFRGVKKNDAIDDFKNVVYRDGLKDQYCKDNNISLLRIPYTEIKNINSILKEYLG